MTNFAPKTLYETFVGNVTPEEFIAPFDGNFEAAISDVLTNWVGDEPIPENFEHQIHRYLVDSKVATF